MLRQELVERVRQIEISTRRMVNDVFTGDYRSQFKGHGIQFSEHRVYQAGDDVRHIDWKASARSRDPLVKKFDEERELTVLLVVDVSASGGFGTSARLKSETIAEVAGMLAYTATHTGDRVGALFFAGEVEKVIPPRKGRNHVLRIVRDVLSFEAKTRGTRLAEALESSSRIMKHAGIVFVLSDFIATGFDRPLKRLALKHDVVAIQVGDEREMGIPNTGTLAFIDPETGIESFVDTGSYAFRKWKEEETKKRSEALEAIFRSSGADWLRIMTKEDHGQAVVRFFHARHRRR